MARLATWARAEAIDVWHRRSDGRFEVILHRVGPALLAVVAGLLTARYAQLLLYLDELREQWGTDLTLYLGATQRFLGGGTFYLERQLHGPYNGQPGDLFYPPPAVLLFAPFEVLPIILWWCVPLSVIFYAIWRWRPSRLGWLAVGLALWWPRTAQLIVDGNPSMWVAAFLAGAFLWGWPGPLILLKPSLAPLAVVGWNTRGWWLCLVGFGLVSLLMLPLWIDYIHVISDGHLDLSYSLHDLPLVLLPLAAWLSRTRTTSAETAHADILVALPPHSSQERTA